MTESFEASDGMDPTPHGEPAGFAEPATEIGQPAILPGVPLRPLDEATALSPMDPDDASCKVWGADEIEIVSDEEAAAEDPREETKQRKEARRRNDARAPSSVWPWGSSCSSA